MLLLEVDGKRLFEAFDIPVPGGVLLRRGDEGAGLPDGGPWIAKAQVPVGGRGKAGGVRLFDSVQALPALMAAMLDVPIKGHLTRSVLVEQAVQGQELYFALMIDPGAGGVRVLFSPAGGIDIEGHGHVEGNFNEVVPLQRSALEAALATIATRMPPLHAAAMADVGERAVNLFLERQLLLLEINPLFALPTGTLVAGDAKVVLDMNVIQSQPALRRIIEDGRDLYPDAWRKLSEDFDFVEIDREGEVGLITTGAGLSMMLLDELVVRGIRPYNFCDIRTGQMRGSPDRLIRVLDWLQEAPNVKQVLINVFAGITDLGEFSRLVLAGLDARPDFKKPIVARLVGNGEDVARTTLSDSSHGIVVEEDLERCLDLLARSTGEAAHV